MLVQMRHTSYAQCGYSLIELLFVIGLFGVLAGIAVPVTTTAIDEMRAAGAARFLAGRLAAARLDAVRRSSTTALRFDSVGADYTFRMFLDGNGNGLRNADIASGVDRPLGRAERLREHFADTAFGLLPGTPDLDGARGNTDGVRVGATSLLSVSPNGSSTSGTLYVHSRRSQYAVRVLGATGRVRVFRYDRGAGRWITR